MNQNLRMPVLMGVVNVTPDSFSDGGQFLDRESAIQHGLFLAESGAEWVDVGGESTRPGADPVSVDEEIARVIPVIGALASRGIRCSIDTQKAEVARVSVAEGATLINDISGFRDPKMFNVALEAKVRVCIMHMQGTPETMQKQPHYVDVVGEIQDYLFHQAETFVERGFERANVWIDPGIGFGKSVDHNLSLLRNLKAFTETGHQVLIGVSRKSFIGKILGSDAAPVPVSERGAGTLAAELLAALTGVSVIRTHDVKALQDALKMALAIGPS